MSMLRKTLSAALALLLSLLPFALADESTLLAKFDMISPLDNNLYAVRKDSLWGIANPDGELILAPQIEQEPIFQDGFAIVSSSQNGTAAPNFFNETRGLQGVIDEAGKVCIPFAYDTIDISENIARACRDEQYFFLDMNGQILAGPYAAADPFRYGCASVAQKSGDDWLWGAIDASGTEIIPCEYAEIRLGNGGPAAVRRPNESKFGFVDMQGNQIIEAKYDDATGFIDGYATVGMQNQETVSDAWGMATFGRDLGAIDEQGNFVLPCEYDGVTVHPGGLIEAYQYDAAGERSYDLWFEVRDGKAVETDKSPSEAAPEAEAEPSNQLNLRPAKGHAGDGELLLERRDGLWRLTNADGATVLDMLFRNEPAFEDGLAAVSIQTDRLVEDLSWGQTPEVLWGLIDDKGQIRIPAEYEELKLSEGIALVRDGEEYAFLAADGAPLSDKRYFRAEPFHDGYAAVAVEIETNADESFPNDTLWGMIDKSGAEVVPCKFDFLELGDGGTAVVSTGESEYAYIDGDGEYLFDARFDQARPFQGEYAVVGKSVENAQPEDSMPVTMLLGVIDRQGEQVLPMEYEEVEILEGDVCCAKMDEEEIWYQLRDGKAVALEG